MDDGHNFGIIKEPRGFLKFIQLLFAILAFATTSGFSSTLKFQVKCSSSDIKTPSFSFSYPFRISSDNSLPKYFCNNTDSSKFIPYGDFAAPSQFFVFVGVVTFLYCLAALIFYIFFNNVYSTNPWGPKSDFIITIGFAIFWFIASVAWADGVSKLKQYTSITRFFYELPECHPLHHLVECKGLTSATYAGLDISLICGFTNIGLWGACVWFIWKECPWYGRQENFNADTGVEAGAGDPDRTMPSAGSVDGPRY